MRLGQQILGKSEGRTAFDEITFETRPYYFGRPWFLSPTIAFYRWLDRRGQVQDRAWRIRRLSLNLFANSRATSLRTDLKCQSCLYFPAAGPVCTQNLNPNVMVVEATQDSF